MNAEVVLDTNVLVYAASKSDAETEKRGVAFRLLQTAGIGLSGQILQEFFVTATRKISVKMSIDEALDWIEAFEEFPCVPVDASLVRQGAEISHRFRVSYWDGAVLAAAHRLRAVTLYSEDLNHGQTYGTVRVINPFVPH